MRLINTIFAVGIVAFIAITRQALQVQLNATDELTHLNEAEQYAEDADRLHDSLRGDLYAALLAPRVSSTQAQDALKAWQLEVTRFRDDLEHQSRLVLTPDVERNINETRRSAEEFLVRTEDLLNVASRDQGALLAQLPAFESRFTDLGRTFDSLNTLLSEDIEAAKGRASLARDQADRSILLAAGLIIAVTLSLAWTITHSIRRSVRDVSAVARSLAAGDLDVRYLQATSHEVGEIGAALNAVAESLERTLRRMRADSAHDRFNKQLAEAFEIADSDKDIGAVAARAMATISAEHPMELLLAEAKELRRVAQHPAAGAAGCTVGSPSKCVAVRRGNTVTYPDSGQLNACPYLHGRGSGELSAVCVPLGFMGNSLGVLHATSTVGAPLEDAKVVGLETLAQNVGTRLGTVRAFQRTQHQATTDSMTGLLNRRAMEGELRERLRTRGQFAIVLADLDHFKKLNDSDGHHAGDRALRLFADAVRAAMRDGDRAARWGGEEFVVLLADAAAPQAADWVERFRGKLQADCKKSQMRVFTASYGIADLSMSTELPVLLRIADAALYVSKTSGRDRATIGSADLGLAAEDHEPNDWSEATAADLGARA